MMPITGDRPGLALLSKRVGENFCLYGPWLTPPPSSELEAGFQPTLAFISPLLLVPITAGGRHSLSQLYNQ